MTTVIVSARMHLTQEVATLDSIVRRLATTSLRLRIIGAYVVTYRDSLASWVRYNVRKAISNLSLINDSTNYQIYENHDSKFSMRTVK